MALFMSEPRLRPRKLTVIHLDRRQAERDAASLSLPELLLATGAMTGPYRRTSPITSSPWTRMRRALRAFRVSRWRPNL